MRQLDDGIGDTLVLGGLEVLHRTVSAFPLCGTCRLPPPLRSLTALARDNVAGVPVRPMVLRSGRLIFVMVLFSLLQQFGQRRDVQITKSSARQPGCDFLKQPSVAVRITKHGE
jgi:hypothetical protein